MKLHEQRTVRRSLEDVFDYTADFSHIADWDPGVASSKALNGDTPGVGSKYAVDAVFGSSTIPMVYEVTAYEPPNRVVSIGESERLNTVDEIKFSAQGDRTVIEYTADLTFRGPIRFVIPFMGPLLKRVGKRAVDGLVDQLVR